jgi:hypothetical protein
MHNGESRLGIITDVNKAGDVIFAAPLAALPAPITGDYEIVEVVE